ncbi:MAG TPA: ATP-binding protein [bacterium]|nr:ATP-binding protein [bacterium]
MKRGKNIILASAMLGVLFWVLDSVLDCYVFHQVPGSLAAAMITRVPAHEIFMRAMVLALFILLGVIVSRFQRQREIAASELTRSEERLRLDGARTEEALKEYQHIISALNQHLPSLFYRGRADRDRTMEFVSEGSAALLGLADQDLAGSKKTSYGALVHPEDREFMWSSMRQALDHGRPYSLTYRIRLAGGEEKWVLDQGIAVPDLGPVAVEGVIIDVTEQRSLEEQLLQSQKMEAVGRLAGGVAHDFNNQLTVIMGLSELMLDALGPSHPNSMDAAEIKRAGEKAAALTAQLLAFSRKQVLQPKVLDLNFMVKDIEKMLCRILGEDIVLETILDPELGEVRADPAQVEQIIMNLAINARDAMANGGKLTIETGNIVLDEEYAASHVDAATGPHVMLSVSDTGRGMDQETRRRIFEPFFTTKELGMGTGLGLSTVYGIVKQSGGNIYVYSEPGKGAAFKVYLPRFFGAKEEERATHEATPLTGDETILVVEDDENVRKLAARFLAGAGYRVIEAEDCGAALAAARQYPGTIHLLLTDVVLPDKNGRELFNLLQQSRPRIKALYMSGYTDNAIVHHGVIEPGTAFLQKPFTAAAIAAKVREALAAE